MVRSAYIRGMCPNIFVLRQGCGAGGPISGFRSAGPWAAGRAIWWAGVAFRVFYGVVMFFEWARIEILTLFGIGVMYCNTRYDPKLG